MSNKHGLKILYKTQHRLDEIELSDIFEDPEERQQIIAYENGLKAGTGIEVYNNTEFSEYINNKYESHYIDGFMVGLGSDK